LNCVEESGKLSREITKELPKQIEASQNYKKMTALEWQPRAIEGEART